MTFVFLLTPIMWRPEILTGKKALLLYANPFAYFLIIVRAPLLGKVPDPIFYYGVVFMIALLFGGAYFLYKKTAHRVVFWV